MVRGKRTTRSQGFRKQRNPRRSRRPVQRSRSTRSFSRRAVLPPAHSMGGHIFRNVVQCLWDVAQGALKTSDISLQSTDPTSYTATIGDDFLFAQEWKRRLKGLFTQYKVHRITARYVPYDSILQQGMYIFSLFDIGENSKDYSVNAMIGQPGTIIRKMGSPSKLEWYPTEPNDRNWQTFGDSHQYCQVVLRTFEDVYNVDGTVKQAANIAGKFVVDVDASFRGKASATGVANTIIPCQCRKCITNRIREQITLEMTLKEAGFDILSPGSSTTYGERPTLPH